MHFREKRLAVLIGSQSRGIKDSHKSINFFLSLFGIPYDVFICSDEADLDNFKLIKNIRSTVSLENIESNNKSLLRNKEKMHKHYWQNAKIFGATTLLQPIIKKYDYGFKMRTDFMFDYRTFFMDHGFDLKDNLTAQHLMFLKDYIRLHLHHCDVRESRPWKSMYASSDDALNLVPFLYNGDRYVFSEVRSLAKFCSNLMFTASNIEKIYTSYIPIPKHYDYNNVKVHLKTIAIPKTLFPNGPPKSAEEIASCFNLKRNELQKIKDVECYPPISSNGKWGTGKDIFCNGKFNADVLSFINQLYTPNIKPSKYGIVKYMAFTRYENNTKSTDQEMKIMQAFHEDDSTYRDSIELENQLKKINHANIPQT